MWPRKKETDKSQTPVDKTPKLVATFLGIDACSLYVAPNRHAEFLESYAIDVTRSIRSYYEAKSSDTTAKPGKTSKGLGSNTRPLRAARTSVSKPKPKSIGDLLNLKLYKQRKTQMTQDWTDEEFLNHVYQVIARSPRFYLVEINGHQWSDVLRVWFELDIKSRSAEVVQRMETEFAEPQGFMQTLSRNLIKFMRQCYPQHGKNMHISVVSDKRIGGIGQKSVSTGTDTSETIYTTGVHLHVCELFVTIRDLLNLRHALVHHLNSQMPLDDLDLYNPTKTSEPATWDTLIDLSPINPNKGLRMPGSFKCDKCTVCDNKQPKRNGCRSCNATGYYHIDKFYWPVTWTYETIQSAHFFNATEFEPSPTHTQHQGFQTMSLDLPDYDLRHYNMLYLTSVKLNSALLAHGEEGQETPFEYRKTPTAGLHIDLKANGASKKGTKRKVTDESLDLGPETTKVQLGNTFEARLGSDNVYMDKVRAALSLCTKKFIFQPDEIVKKTSEDVPNVEQVKKPCPFKGIASNIKLGQNPMANVVRWKDIEIVRVQCFMVKLHDIQRQEILKAIPMLYHDCEIVKKWKSLPYVLCGYLTPVKNIASKQCPFKHGEEASHSKNNIFFQFLVPVYSQDMSKFKSEGHYHESLGMADWAAYLLNTMRKDPKKLLLPEWFIRVRCFSEKCKTEAVDYGMPWRGLLNLIEPALQRILVESHYRYSPEQQEYIKT